MGAASGTVLAGTGALAGGCGEHVSPLPVRSVDSLPQPQARGSISLRWALSARRSQREFTTEPVNELEISQLLWAAQGITADWGGRTAPSAGGLYPLELYLLTPGA